MELCLFPPLQGKGQGGDGVIFGQTRILHLQSGLRARIRVSTAINVTTLRDKAHHFHSVGII